MKRLLYILPIIFVFVACNQQKSSNQHGSEPTVDDSTVVVVVDSIYAENENDSIPAISDELIDYEGADGGDYADMCYQNALEEVERYKGTLAEKVLSSTDTSIYYKTSEGLNGYIVRDARCHGDEWLKLDIKITGFDNKNWQTIDNVKTIFASQLEMLPGENAQTALNMLLEKELAPNHGNTNVWNCKPSKENPCFLIIRFDNDSTAVLNFGK